MHSMTGFGRAELTSASALYTIEARSVNHRYIDVRLRLPSSLSTLEHRLGECVRSRFARGAFDITIRHKTSPAVSSVNATRYVVDELAVSSLIACVQELKQVHGFNAGIDLNFLANLDRVFVPLDETPEADDLMPQLVKALDSALDELEQMRNKEGLALQRLLKDGADTVIKLTDQIRLLSGEQSDRISEKLAAKVKSWQLEGPDPHRLEWEIVYYAQRADITEELDRLKQHTDELHKCLGSSSAVGRKLDFLIQEMNREVNTMGAKSAMIEITQIVVEAKAQIEKLREQVQNVE